MPLIYVIRAKCSFFITNEDWYIFLLITAFLCISHTKSQDCTSYPLHKEQLLSFVLVGPDPSYIFLGCCMSKDDKFRGIIISKQEISKCIVGIFKASCKTCKKQLPFVISAQTALVTPLKNISVLYVCQITLHLFLHQMLTCPWSIQSWQSNCLSTHIITSRQFWLCTSSLESPTVWRSRWIVLQTQKVTCLNEISSIAVVHFLLLSRALLVYGFTRSLAVKRRIKWHGMCSAHYSLMLKSSLEGEYNPSIARLNHL